MLLLQDGWTALHVACFRGQTETVKLLLNNNADISATNNVSDKILLSVKHSERHYNHIQYIITLTNHMIKHTYVEFS